MIVSFSNFFTFYVIKVEFNFLGNEVNNALYLFSCWEIRVLIDADELYDGFREDDLADIDINMLVL